MIVAETDGGYRFVTQPAHAALAGQFADRWGNDRVAAPAPRAPVLAATYRHDTGWVAYDRLPHLGEDGRPVGFTDVPATTWIDIYDAGVDAVAEIDAYAGLLVSMHGTGLRRQRYGLSPSWPATSSAYAEFVERQEALQRQLLATLREDGRVSETDEALLDELHATGVGPTASAERSTASAERPSLSESRLWTNYKLLQAWDALSLAFCTTAWPPRDGEIRAVPTTYDRADVTLAVERLADGRFRIDPYPFETAPLVVSVPTRTVSTSAFDDEASLVRAYYCARRERLTFTLVDG